MELFKKKTKLIELTDDDIWQIKCCLKDTSYECFTQREYEKIIDKLEEKNKNG